ncbi:MAG TPA: Wzz/FepE/Etk N-terminal domain-containing protein [Thermomicrobiales bacterium]|nr:Wzz/FepE/Etk N-terminal domain-containing protein [Thermomicrobiales bacterium]
MEIELRQVFRAAIRWGWLIVLVTVLAGALAFFLTKGQTETYSATTTLMVNPQQVTSSTDNSSLQASRSQADTYVRLVKSGPVLDQVREDLGLSLTRNELTQKIEASTVMNTQLIEITVKDASADEAARIANGVAEAFRVRVVDLTTGRLQDNLQQATSESATLRARITEIDTEVSSLDTDANRDNADIQQQITSLKGERSRAQETVADLDSTIRTINQQLATMTAPVEVADMARAARQPDSPKPALMTALGLFLGFLVGCGLAAVLQISDRKVRAETDIEDLTGARLLAIVPMNKARQAGELVMTAQPDSAAAEAIRMLRTHLQGFVDAHPHGTLALANAGAGTEGSELLVNLGVALAQSGTSTLLVDANLRAPYVHQMFGLGNETGLANAVESSSSPVPAEEVAPGLRVVTAGTTSGHPASIVSGAAFTQAVREASHGADFTLINTPPALSYSDALSVASKSDGVLVIARYGETGRDDLEALATTIRDDGKTLVGVVMTQD